MRNGFGRGALVALLPVLTLALPGRAPAQQAGAEEQTITVAAVGRVERAPDRAVVRLIVETFAATAREAAAENAERTDGVLAALRRLGLEPDRIRTLGYQLHPEYERGRVEPRGPGERRLVGYRAANAIQVTIDDVDRVGTVIDAAIAAGADHVDGPSFQLRDPDAARRDALRRATERARAEAEVLAEALGRRLGPALAVSTTGGVPRPIDVMRMERAAFESAPMATPIQPGTLEVEASVTVVFRLDPHR